MKSRCIKPPKSGTLNCNIIRYNAFAKEHYTFKIRTVYNKLAVFIYVCIYIYINVYIIVYPFVRALLQSEASEVHIQNFMDDDQRNSSDPVCKSILNASEAWGAFNGSTYPKVSQPSTIVYQWAILKSPKR